MKILMLDNQHEYNFVKEDDNYFVYYSQSEQWNSDVRGTLAFSMINDGNGYKITQKSKGKLDYSESFLLYFLLRLEYKEYDIKIGELNEI